VSSKEADVRKKAWIVLLAAVLLILLATGLRLFALERHPVPAGDGGLSQMVLAVSLIKGEGFVSHWRWTFFDPGTEVLRPEGLRQPLLPLALSLLFRLIGVSYRAGQGLILLVDLAALAVAFLLARRLFDWRAAIFALGLGAVSALRIYYAVQVEEWAPFGLFFFLLLLLIYARGDERGALPLWGEALSGLLLGLLYLCRTNGLLLLGAYAVHLLAARRWKLARAVLPGLVVLVGFLAVSSPWLIRNYRVFGNPLHTDSTTLLYIDQPADLWSAKAGAPSALANLAHGRSLEQIALHQARGLYVALEPLVNGNLWRNERFAIPGMPLLFALAVFGLLSRSPLRRHTFLLVGLLLHLLALSSYQHVARYYFPYYTVLEVFGAGGFFVLADLLWPRRAGEAPRGAWACPRLVVLLVGGLVLFPLIRPLGLTMLQDWRPEGRRVREAALYLRDQTAPDAVVMDAVEVEKEMYLYQRPTVQMPTDDLQAVIEVARRFDVDYLAVYPSLVEARPFLAQWFAVDGRRIVERELPPFLTRVYTDRWGELAIYRFEELTSGAVSR
jgi:hypothetical protein